MVINTFNYLGMYVVTILALFSIAWSAPADSSSSSNLTILHTNDVHAHYKQFNKNGGQCSKNLAQEGKCFGGFARQVTKIKEIRNNEDNVLFLNGGDFFQGTVWYTLHKWKAVTEFVNRLTIDAMSLGNHEFDDGIQGLAPYLRALKPNVTVCNIDTTKEPEIDGYIHKSIIKEIDGEKYGIIGYLTTETPAISSTGNVEFFDEIGCIKEEARRLSDEGIKRIIAVGHAGFNVDLGIAKAVPEVDIVVGGHTNTFLYTGEPPSNEIPVGPYPTVVEREDGSKGLIVQDFAFAKYLGYLQVQFDEDGNVVRWGGNPILLDKTVEQDPEILEVLKPYEEEVLRRGRQKIGHTNVYLEGSRTVCRLRECNLGNYLADASLDYFVSNPTEDGSWTNAAVAIWNSGGIRGTIDEQLNNGTIILEDILTVAPFGNTIDIVTLTGKHIKEFLEESVANYDLNEFDPPGSFLQVSGLRIVYNVSNPPYSRVLDVKIRCADCRIPEYFPLDEEKIYEVVTPSYLTKKGGEIGSIEKNAISNRNTDELDLDVISAYMKKTNPIITGLEGRITVLSTVPELTSTTTTPDTIKSKESKDETTEAYREERDLQAHNETREREDISPTPGVEHVEEEKGGGADAFKEIGKKAREGAKEISDKVQTRVIEFGGKVKDGFKNTADTIGGIFKSRG